MCLLLGAVGMAAVVVVGWRQVRGQRRARPARARPGRGRLGGGPGLPHLVRAGRAAVGDRDALRAGPDLRRPALGPAGVGPVRRGAVGYIRFSGYLGRNGPPADYVGWGVALVTVAAVVAGRRRALTWLLLLLAAVTFWLALGAYLLGGPAWLGHPWLPWCRAVLVAGAEGDPARSVRPVGDVVPRLPARGRPGRLPWHLPEPALVPVAAPGCRHRCGHCRRRRGRPRPGLRDVQRTAAGGARAHPALPTRRGELDSD